MTQMDEVGLDELEQWAMNRADDAGRLARELLTYRRGGHPYQGNDREHDLLNDIETELVRARAKFPGKNVTFAALVEEVGELATATFEEGRDRVRKEAVQVAVMAMRMVLDGDHTFDGWRAARGLDPLTDVDGEGGS